MGLGHSPQIVTNGMVLCLDAANPKNYNLTEVEVLVVAGGGGGGSFNGGGGGAGGLIYNSNFAVTPGSALTVTVGAGGIGDGRPGNGATGASGAVGTNGGNSVFGSLTAIGGGVGATYSVRTSGVSGGSGGGSWGALNFASGTAGQGNAGGGGYPIGNFYTETAGGGGGSGSNGVDGGTSSNQPGAGGLGLLFNISGNAQFYAAGGAAGANRYGGSALGGSGIGGNGGTTSSLAGVAGVSNTGSGGGGAAYNSTPGSSADGGAGGSGIIIVRYPGSQRAIGGTITSNNGYTIHTFTTSGNFTPLVATNNSAILGLSDFSGNGNFGTTANSPTYSSANGGSVSFDGSNDYVELNTNNIISGTNPFTFEAFYKVTNASVNAELFGNYGSGYTSNTIWISGRYGVYINTTVPYFQGYPLGVGTYHMAFTRTSAGACTLYKNGVVDGTATSTTSISSSQNFRIGSDVNGIAEVFGGELYSMKVYNRALSAAEVSQNFNALRGRFGI